MWATRPTRMGSNEEYAVVRMIQRPKPVPPAYFQTKQNLSPKRKELNGFSLNWLLADGSNAGAACTGSTRETI